MVRIPKVYDLPLIKEAPFEFLEAGRSLRGNAYVSHLPEQEDQRLKLKRWCETFKASQRFFGCCRLHNWCHGNRR